MVEMNHFQNFRCFCYGLLIFFQIPIISFMNENEILFKHEDEEIVYQETEIKDENEIKQLGLNVENDLRIDTKNDDFFDDDDKNIDGSFSNI